VCAPKHRRQDSCRQPLLKITVCSARYENSLL
jgi:hypothetical protein